MNQSEHSEPVTAPAETEMADASVGPGGFEPAGKHHTATTGAETTDASGIVFGPETADASGRISGLDTTEAAETVEVGTDTQAASSQTSPCGTMSAVTVEMSEMAQVGVDAGELTTVPGQAAWGWRSNFDQFMPVVLFLVFYNLVNTEVAVIAATAWSVKAAYSRRRRGLPIGTWLPVITGYLLARAAVSIAVERDLVDFGVSSEAVYFGIGIGTKTLIGLAAAASVLVGKPFLVWASRRFLNLSDEILSHPRFVATMRNLTWVIACYEVGSSIWDIWLYNSAGLNLFLITRQVVNFVVAFLLIFVSLVYLDRRLSKIDGCPGLVELIAKTTNLKVANQMSQADTASR